MINIVENFISAQWIIDYFSQSMLIIVMVDSDLKIRTPEHVENWLRIFWYFPQKLKFSASLFI